MPNKFLLTAFSKDRPGVVADIAQHAARVAMIEKQAGVQVASQVDLELQAAFPDHQRGPLLVQLFVL